MSQDLVMLLILSQVILIPVVGLQLLAVRAERIRNERLLRASLRVLSRRAR